MQDSVLRVVEGRQTREFRRADLLSIVEGGGSELDYWSGKFGLGLAVLSGNTDQADVNTTAFLRRDGTTTRFDVNYASNVGELDGVESVNNHLGSARLDAFLSRRVFVTPIGVQLYSDRFQNIELRTSVATGAGYYFIRRKALEWFVLAGAGYLSTLYRSVAAGEDIEDKSASVIPATSVEWDVAKDVDFDFDYSVTVDVPDTERRYHHMVVLFTIENLRFVDLTTSVTWDRTAKPKPREDGSVPKRDDLRTSFGIAIDF
jgi:hypothetical protein